MDQFSRAWAGPMIIGILAVYLVHLKFVLLVSTMMVLRSLTTLQDDNIKVVVYGHREGFIRLQTSVESSRSIKRDGLSRRSFVENL